MGTNGTVNRVSQYMGHDFRVIPIKTDGSKAPKINQWKPFQDPDHPPCDIEQFQTDCGIGILCGACSGNLEVMDFDEPGLFKKYATQMESLHPDIIKHCVIIDTPAGGNHIWYRCEEDVQGNQKLAMSTDGKKVRIETRGEGGYVLGPGSPNECHHTGNIYRVNRYGARISEIPTITAEERESLLRVARTFDRRKPKDETLSESEDKGRPGDEFNKEADWEPILEPYGWKKAGKCGPITYWTRPDKKTGVSATTGIKSQAGLDLFCCFTTSCPEFSGPDGTSSCSVHTKFDAFCRLHHKGNHKAGAADLAEKGFGTKLEATVTHWYTYSELVEMDWEVNYIVEDCLAAGHSTLMFGPSKSLKTTLASELAICLAMGIPFLDTFNIPAPVKTGMISGESGKATMRDTFMRIAQAKGLDTIDNFIFSPNLPKLGNEKKLASIEKDIIDHELKVLILDPAYLCINVGDRESSLFAVGAVLNPFFEVCEAHGVTPIILHHCKQSVRPGRAVTISDLSWAGFEQIARQWIGLNRMEEYEEGTGTHDLMVSLGGSPGHSSKWRITVEEGTDHNLWSTEVNKAAKREIVTDEMRQVVLETIREHEPINYIGINQIHGSRYSKSNVQQIAKELKKDGYIDIIKGIYCAIDGLSASNANKED